MQSLLAAAFMLIASAAAQDDECVTQCTDLYVQCCHQAFPDTPACLAFTKCHLRALNIPDISLCGDQGHAACQEWCDRDQKLAILPDGSLGCGPNA